MVTAARERVSLRSSETPLLTQTFAYDYLNRLSSFTDSGGSNPNQRTFQYDNFGNLALGSWTGDMTPNAATPAL